MEVVTQLSPAVVTQLLPRGGRYGGHKSVSRKVNPRHNRRSHSAPISPAPNRTTPPTPCSKRRQFPNVAMYVIKRGGARQEVHFDKITERIRTLCEMEPQLEAVDPVQVAQQVIQGLRAGMTTTELDLLASETVAYRTIDHPDFGTLAARIEVSNLHKNTCGDVVEVAGKLHAAGLMRDEVAAFIRSNGETLRRAIDYGRDFDFDYFGIKTLLRAYLINIDKDIVERPQDMWMRVAVEVSLHGWTREGEGIPADTPTSTSTSPAILQAAHQTRGLVNDLAIPARSILANVLGTYELLSRRYYTHATPTLFSAGMTNSQMSSCFLLDMREDSIAGIFDTLKQCALISKFAGGIGLSVTRVRATGSYIAGTNGRSNGIVPMLRIFNNAARYVDQGGGKRKGSFAMYIEPWHADVEEFLELRKNHGKEEARARDLFLALWVPDLFMRRVEAKGVWSLFCPNECPGLADTYGEEFEALYTRYEAEGKAKRQVSALLLWQKIMTAQIETGTPYMLFKDHINRKSQQANVGIIRSSNLCAEIVEHTSADEIAVCNLASINLSRFFEPVRCCFADSRDPSKHHPDLPPELMDAPVFTSFDVDFGQLYRVTRAVVRNLNAVIDGNAYPVDEARSSNLRNRPIGLGVQGLADLLAMLRLPFGSERAMLLNRLLFETMYHAAVTESCALAETYGAYPSYPGSPASQGRLQFDLWAEQGHFDRSRLALDWGSVKERIARHGLRNSLLLALMPTASTSQILGNNESFEPFTSNMYSRRTLAGEFAVVNKHLQRELIERNLWDRALAEKLMAANGSVQEMGELPAELRETFRTVWEIPQKVCVDMAMERGPFVDQTQSFNVFMAAPTVGKLSAMLFYSWRAGAKTGSYYLRTKPSAQPIKFTVRAAAAAGGAGVAAGGGAAAGSSGAIAGGGTPKVKEEEQQPDLDEGCLSCSA